MGGHQKRKEEEALEGRRVSKPATGRLTIVLWMGWRLLGEGGLQLPPGDWLTDGKKKKVPHDPHPVAPQPRRAGRGLKPPIVVPSHRITKAPAVREGWGVGERMGLVCV